MSEPTGSAPAGGMPAGGGMPSAPPPGDYSAPGVVSPGVEAAEEAPDDDALALSQGPPAGQAPAAPAPDAGFTPLPPTPHQTEIAQAAQGLLVLGEQVQQQWPQVQAAKQALEAQLAPYYQNPDLFNQLPPEAQYAVRQGDARYRQLAQYEQKLVGDWQQVTQNAPQLQQMYALAQREATLNQVGEPVAYHYLAQRAAKRSGDPDFPVAEMMEFLQGTPASILEAQATKYEQLYKKGRLRERAAGRVDDMGPGGGGAASSRPRSGRAMVDDAIHSELRQRPPR